MKILITGATGFIGAQFMRRYAHHSFTALSRHPTQAKQALTFSGSTGSVEVIHSLIELPDLNGFDAVINLAGEAIANKRWTDKQKAEICESRWQLTRQLVQLIKQSTVPPKTFISGSAIGFYGDAGTEKLTERSEPKTNDFAHKLCERWENIALEAKDHCRVAILRTGIVLGIQGGALAKMILPFKLGFGGEIASGNQVMSWIHQRDAIRAIEFLLNQPTAEGVFNITAPTPVNNRAFTQALAEVLHRKALLPLPAPILKLLMGESASLLLGSQNVHPEKLLLSGFTFDFSDLSNALDNLVNAKST